MTYSANYYLRRVLGMAARLCRDSGRRRYPKIEAALTALRMAIEVELPKTEPPTRKSTPRRLRMIQDGGRLWRQRYLRLEKRYAELSTKMKCVDSAKTYDGRLSEEWIQRIICCCPHTSGRALAQTFGLAEGSDKSLVSRWSIPRVKAAWVEMYTEMVAAATGACVASERAATGAVGGEFVSVVAPHTQDEADIRVLSGHARDGPAIPRRQRASKVY